jgi:hypothetical protein
MEVSRQASGELICTTITNGLQHLVGTRHIGEDRKGQAGSTATKSEASKSKWMTYRVQNIPATYDRKAFREALAKCLLLDEGSVEVLSLATNFARVNKKSDISRTATVTIGSWVDSSQFIAQKLLISHPESGVENTVDIDKDFLGFTPLSPMEDDEKHSIE